jgi:sigma-B regulation protein RsbU (phosphoserine phosphatase)
MEIELAELRREQKELHQAIFEAAQVQRTLCAPRDLWRGSFEIAAEMFPVRHLSGDFYKVFDLGSRIGLAVGDIAGKGLSAGIWLAHMIGLLHICAREHSEPAAAMAALNRELSEGDAARPLTALFLGCLNLQTSELEYCNAGQPAALLLRRSGAVDSLQTGGPMLGALREAKFEAGRVTMEAGDTLVAFTDGVVECSNAKDEEFGMRRLTAAAGAAGGSDASRALFSTLGAALDFAGGRAPADDLTLLVVHRRDYSAGAARSAIGFDR